MGCAGRPNTTTPEDLFAADCACFGSAREYMGVQMKLRPSSVEVHATVGNSTLQPAGFGHTVCPYLNAMKGNVEVFVTVAAA